MHALFRLLPELISPHTADTCTASCCVQLVQSQSIQSLVGHDNVSLSCLTINQRGDTLNCCHRANSTACSQDSSSDTTRKPLQPFALGGHTISPQIQATAFFSRWLHFCGAQQISPHRCTLQLSASKTEQTSMICSYSIGPNHGVQPVQHAVFCIQMLPLGCKLVSTKTALNLY